MCVPRPGPGNEGPNTQAAVNSSADCSVCGALVNLDPGCQGGWRRAGVVGYPSTSFVSSRPSARSLRKLSSVRRTPSTSGVFGIGIQAQQLGDLLVMHRLAQAVGAEQEPIAIDKVELVHFASDTRRRTTQNVGHDVPPAVRPRLLGRELAGALELGGQRVVVGELLDPAVADAVGAGVTDVAHRDQVVLDERDGDRRPHARCGDVLG